MQAIIARYRTYFKHGSFGHNVLVMFTGTAIGQFGAIFIPGALPHPLVR